MTISFGLCINICLSESGYLSVHLSTFNVVVPTNCRPNATERMGQSCSQSNTDWMVYQHPDREQVTTGPYVQRVIPQVAYVPDAIQYHCTYYYPSAGLGYSKRHDGSESYINSSSSRMDNSNAPYIQYPMDSNSAPSTQMYPTCAATGLTEYGVRYNPAVFYARSGGLGHRNDNRSEHGSRHDTDRPAEPRDSNISVKRMYSDPVDQTSQGGSRAVSKPSRKRGSVGRWTDIEHETFLRGLNTYGRKWYVLCCLSFIFARVFGVLPHSLVSIRSYLNAQGTHI